MHPQSPVRFDELHGGAVLRITLADPPSNTLDAHMTSAIADVLDAAGARRERKLILFRAEGANFSVAPTGVAKGHGGDRPALHGVLRRLMALGTPTCALVQGDCFGQGLALAAFTNFVFAASDARFGLDTLAGWPLTASLILPLKLGHGHADDLVLTGESISVAEAYRRGLVLAWARPGESLDALADAWILSHLLSRSASSLVRANRTARLSFHAQLDRDLMVLDGLTASTQAGAEPLLPDLALLPPRPSRLRALP